MKRPPEALRSAKLFDSGAGYLVVSRFKADGRVESGFFLLDVFCLGVKDAGFHSFNSITDYQESLLDRLFADEDPVQMTPAAARKLTEDAVSYARGLGFSPGADYKKASRVFGGVTTAECDEEFIFGKDGKPLYIQGPSDSPARVERILGVLEARCGEGGYHYIVPVDDFESLDGEEENGEDAITGPVDRAGLEAMAAGLRASRPGVEVRIDPPGHRKVSDIICRVAEPLLEFAPDLESKQMALNLTALAWNFTLLDPTAQEQMLVEIADLFKCREGLEIFLFLADRAMLLYPDEDRFIYKVETEPALFGDVAVRVAWAS
ncbi:MAG: hypothetical protein JO070_11295 [Verrucomicrobia bacterium]|nr:hypothetical protein [Verrucomicrobiota bacterium]